jgi:hypothetical protein
MNAQSATSLIRNIRRNQPGFYQFLVTTNPQYSELGAFDITALMDNLTKNIGSAATAYYGAKQQNKLLETNLKLAQQGKPLIDPSSVAPTFRVDVDNPLTRNLANYLPVILLAAGGLIAWKMFGSNRKTRR